MKGSLLKYFILLIAITFSLCKQSADTSFSEVLQTSKSNKQVRVQGSKVFVEVPADFRFMKELARYQKNDQLYFQVIESHTNSFLDARQNFTKEAFKAKGAEVDVLKAIKFNEYEGIYCEGPSKFPDETKLMFIFGDKDFLVMVVGVCKTSDPSTKQALQKIFKTLWYDASTALDPLELVNFEFDQTLTGFKCAATISNMFVYTQEGNAAVNDPTGNAIQVMSLPGMSEGKLYRFATDLLWRYESNGIKLEHQQIEPVTINGYTGFVYETEVLYNSKPGILYQVVLSGKGSGVAFIAYAYDNVDKYRSLYKQTAQTIRIK